MGLDCFFVGFFGFFFLLLFVFPERAIVSCLCFSDNNCKCISSVIKTVWFRNKKRSTRNNPHCAQNLQNKGSQKQLPEQKLVNQIVALIWACWDSPAWSHVISALTSVNQKHAFQLLGSSSNLLTEGECQQRYKSIAGERYSAVAST